MSKIKVRTEFWRDIPASRKRALLAMTLPHGMMRDFVRKSEPLIFTAYLTGPHKGKRVGWAAYHPIKKSAMFFVQNNYRKKGAGKALMAEIAKIAKERNAEIEVYPHSNASESFLGNEISKREQVKKGSAWLLESEYKFGAHYSSSIKHPRKQWL